MEFDLAELASGPHLPVRARIIVQGALSGIHRARLKGSSVEFAQHKEYSPGDELRHLDWKVYAKADRYYIKQFEQESELTVHLVLDTSGSMAYRRSGPSKLVYAAHVLAALAYLLIHQRDKVGLHAFGDPDLDRTIPPRGRPAHLRDLMQVLEDICRHGARGDEPISPALERIGELSGRRRAMVVIASDLFEPGTRATEVMRWLRARGHDVVLFHILDPDEIELPFEGLTRFVSMESKAEMLTNPTAIRREYRKRLTEFLSSVDSTLKTGGVEYHLTRTDQPVEATVRAFLERRLSIGGTR